LLNALGDFRQFVVYRVHSYRKIRKQ